MNLLDRIFGEKKAEEAQAPKIPLKEIEGFLSDSISEKFEQLKGLVKTEYDNLRSAMDLMKNQLKALEEVAYPQSTYPIIVSKSTVSRKNFVGKMRLLIEKTSIPQELDVKTSVGFYRKLNSDIFDVDSQTTKDYAFLKILFEREGKEVVDSFRRMTEIKNSLGKALEGIIRSEELMRRIRGNLFDVLELTSELDKNELAATDNAISEKEGEARRCEDESRRLLESSGWKDVNDLKKTIEDEKGRMRSIKADFEKYIDDIQAPLKKYRRSAGSKVLDDYTNKSFDSVICEDPKAQKLASYLSEIKIMIIEKRMDIKDTDSFLFVIDNIKDNNLIGNMFETYQGLSENIKANEEKIINSEVCKRKSRTEKETEQAKKDIENIKTERIRLEEKVNKMRKEREIKIEEIEEMTHEISGKKVELVLS